MRELRFRAFHIANNAMVYFDPDTAAKDAFQAAAICRLMAGSDEGHLMQYTGLKDKSGVEIYEGDVISWDAREWGSPFFELVRWDYEQLDSRKNDWPQWCMVAGNIHENPELLEEV